MLAPGGLPGPQPPTCRLCPGQVPFNAASSPLATPPAIRGWPMPSWSLCQAQAPGPAPVPKRILGGK